MEIKLVKINKLVTFICCLSVVGIASADLEERVSALEAEASLSALENKLSLGGYGEFHATRKSGNSYGDYHRVVMYAGYQFSDSIRLNSEIELENAKTAIGYVLLEQFNIGIDLSETTTAVLGRSLAPMGIVGPRHEPPLFFGVERPNVEKYILPSTWSIDGVGLVGDLSTDISYEVYAVGGLDASGFNEEDGIRGSREAAYQGLESPSITGRIDYHGIENLRVGVSMFSGSTDHGSKGTDYTLSYDDDATGSVTNSITGFSGTEVSITSLDFEYSNGPLSINGLFVEGEHDGNVTAIPAGNTLLESSNGALSVAASEFDGQYFTVGYEIWREGEKAIVPFVRLSEYTTHDSVDTIEGTKIGANIYLTNQFVLKADLLTEEEGGTETDTFSVGFGMMFQ